MLLLGEEKRIHDRRKKQNYQRNLMALTGVPTIEFMGYSALLFCPDDKTARTVTQVLSELEFSVETCAEPFAAVKKLMGGHFDALVVDCDNEQNATLLFKSARNSTSNQASLAVAVVEGQAGVAKAFRIGANLVLTKPINVEQAKGTLRVARGLLRKGEPGKPAVAPAPAAAAPAAPSAKPVPAKPAAPPRPMAAAPVASSRPASLPPKPVPAPPPAAPPQVPVASAHPAVDEDLFEISREGPSIAPPPAPPVVAVPELPQPIPAPAAETKPLPKPVSAPTSFGGSAASAPAPAREAPPAIKETPVTPSAPSNSVADSLFEKPAEPAPVAPAASAVAPPSFTFGGSNVEEESSGGSKKILIGVAAAVIVAAGAYFAWTHFQGGATSSQTVSAPPSVASQPASTPSAPAAVKPAATTAASTARSTEPNPVETNTSSASAVSDDSATIPEKEVAASPAKGTTSKPSTKSEEAPLLVKSGTAPARHATPSVDAPAPSVIGMGAPSSGAPLPSLSSGSTGPKPVLQTLNISQGVSSGLLLKKVQPMYPQNAMAMHVEGAVELMATISKTGTIANLKVLSGPPLLTRAASDAVKQWKYAPYLLNGEPVEIQTQITVNFKLPH